MISAIIPTYRNPDYLDLCLRSAVEGRMNQVDTQIIVVVDGYPEESKEVISKYHGINSIELPENMGMQYALNIGVMNANNPWIFIMNDDNVFGSEWDKRFGEAIYSVAGESWTNFEMDTIDPEDVCIQINQVEPTPSIFDFVTNDLGRTAADFKYDAWLDFEPTIAQPEHYTPNGRLFPFLLTKKWYQAVGGFDTFYKSPFWCDVDFFTKLETTNQIKFRRWHGAHLYHFGSIATKNRGDAEAELFKRSEGSAAQTFQYKWGFIPNLVESARLRDNEKSPKGEFIKGIQF